MRRLRTKTSSFLVALCHQKWCRQCWGLLYIVWIHYYII
jgi:hypothetical protein